MIEFILAVVAGLLVRSVADECGIGFKSVARWIVRRSVRLLAEQRERYEEQWLADLEDRKTAIRQMLFALGVVLAAGVLRRESPQSRDAVKPATRTLPASVEGLSIAEQDLLFLNEMLANLPKGTAPESIRVISREVRNTTAIQVGDLVIIYRVSAAAKIDSLSNWLRRTSHKK